MSEALPLSSGEQEVLCLRQHWIIFGQRAVIYVLFLAIPLALWWLRNRFAPQWFLDPTAFSSIGIKLLASAYLLFVLQAFFTAWVDYALDVWIVTNQRILNVNQHGLFHRTISELSLEKVQDVSSETKGLFATMFGFGAITVETAGEEENFEFVNLPHPEQIAKQILEQSRALEQTRPAAPAPPVDSRV